MVSGARVDGEEFFEEQAGEAGRVVAEDAVFFEEIIEDDAHVELPHFLEFEENGHGTLGAVAASDLGRNRAAVGDDKVHHAPGNVQLDGAQMIGKSVIGGFAGLGH